jgi:tetratricopeptide (TPR) repeat protein
VPHRLAAGAQAQRLHALAEAMAHWHKALADGATPAQALPAHQGLMQAARVRCEFDAMLAHGEALQALAAQAPGALLTADERAGALVAVADNLAFGNRAAQALAMLDRLPPTLTEAVQGQMLVVRSRAMQALGRVDEAKAAALAALALPSLPVDVRLDLLDSQIRAEFAAGELGQARAHADVALALAQAHGDEAGMARAQLRIGLALLVGGELAAAEAELQRAVVGFGGRGVVYMQRIALYNLSLVYEAQSQHVQALATAKAGWDLQPPLPSCDLRVMYRLAFVDASNALGDLGTAWSHAQEALAEVLAQDEPFTLLAAANCTLELLGLLGENALAQRLLQAADREAVRELRLAAPELWIVAAQFALARGDVAAARLALATVGQPAQIADVRVRARHALAQAELVLAEGDATAAAQGLPADDAPGMNAEMRTRALALQLRAQAAGGALATATVQAALTELDRPSPYAPATLQLHAALVQARRQGLAGAPPDAPERQAPFVEALARSLQAHPVQQAAFQGRAAQAVSDATGPRSAHPAD